MLRVKRLDPAACLPVVAHPGEDLGYDLFALESVALAPRATARVRTGIAVEARDPRTGTPLGLLVRDRSSMAARGIATTGGVIDAGYRGEILVLMTNLGVNPVELRAGDKIAQMVPVPILTGPVEEVAALESSARQAKGFGSSGGARPRHRSAQPSSAPGPVSGRFRNGKRCGPRNRRGCGCVCSGKDSMCRCRARLAGIPYTVGKPEIEECGRRSWRVSRPPRPGRKSEA